MNTMTGLTPAQWETVLRRLRWAKTTGPLTWGIVRSQALSALGETLEPDDEEFGDTAALREWQVIRAERILTDAMIREAARLVGMHVYEHTKGTP